MAIRFEAPPLVQAVCEFQFDENNWKGEAAGQFFERWRERLPTLLMPDFGQDAIRFFSEDSTRCVAMCPGLLSVSLSAPYTNWDDFKEFIEQALRNYHELAPINEFSRVGLRYLNSIKVPRPEPFDKYITLPPRTPDGMEPSQQRKVGFFVERTSMIYLDLNGELSFFQGVRGDPDEGVLLNLDFATHDASLLNISNVMDWLETAHDEIEKVFLRSITAHTRKAFQEKK